MLPLQKQQSPESLVSPRWWNLWSCDLQFQGFWWACNQTSPNLSQCLRVFNLDVGSRFKSVFLQHLTISYYGARVNIPALCLKHTETFQTSVGFSFKSLPAGENLQLHDSSKTSCSSICCVLPLAFMSRKTAAFSQFMQEEGGLHDSSRDWEHISTSYQSLHLSDNQQVKSVSGLQVNTVMWTLNQTWQTENTHRHSEGERLNVSEQKSDFLTFETICLEEQRVCNDKLDGGWRRTDSVCGMEVKVDTHHWLSSEEDSLWVGLQGRMEKAGWVGGSPSIRSRSWNIGS